MMCEGKVALVTGATGKCMGRSIALTLAREGAKVILNYRTASADVDALVSYIQGKGGEAIACQADICDQSQCRSLYDQAVNAFGRIDICVVGPGGGWHPEPVNAIDVAGALDDVAKELAPLYNLMPLFLPGMFERKWGRLIAIGLLLERPSPSFAYDTAKAARMAALRRMKDAAWQNGVTVNAIAPGPVGAVDTVEAAVEMCEHGPKWLDRANVTPQDIAEGVAMLCSEAGRFITGCEMPFLFM